MLILPSHDNVMPAFGALNERLHIPSDLDKRTAFEIGKRSDVGFYEWMDSHPKQRKAFYGFMIAQSASLPTWLDAIDFASDFGYKTNAETKLLVDVGGGNGQHCADLIKRYPNMEGEIVLQDRPSVLANVNVAKKV